MMIGDLMGLHPLNDDWRFHGITSAKDTTAMIGDLIGLHLLNGDWRFDGIISAKVIAAMIGDFLCGFVFDVILVPT